MKKRTPLFKIATLLLFAAILSAVIAFVKAQSLIAAAGEVVSIEDSSVPCGTVGRFATTTYCPGFMASIRFEDSSNKEVLFKTFAGVNLKQQGLPKYHRGEAVEIQYPKENPEKAFVKETAYNYLLPLLLLITAILIYLINLKSEEIILSLRKINQKKKNLKK